MINQKNLKKKSISEKIAGFLHISIKRAKQDFPIIKQIIKDKPDVFRKINLTEEEIEYLKN